MKSAVVFLADGFEEVEALTPVDYLRRAGVEVFTVAVPSTTMNDPYIVMGSHKIPVIADMNFDEFKQEFETELPDLVFAPGGMNGSKNLAANEEVLSFIKKCSACRLLHSRHRSHPDQNVIRPARRDLCVICDLQLIVRYLTIFLLLTIVIEAL